MEDQPPGRGGRVDLFSQGAEACAAFADGLNYIQEIAQGTRLAIVLSDDDDIAVAELIEELIALKSLISASDR